MHDNIRKFIMEGTVMFISDRGDSDIGVSPESLDKFMQEYVSVNPGYLYYGIRYTGVNNSGLHLDFIYCAGVDTPNGDKKGVLEKVFTKGLKHALTKEYGSAFKGNDVTHSLSSTYLNLELANKLYKE